MSSKTSCVTCENKDMSGIFKCEGCSQIFCLKHTNEHRQILNYQLDEIIFEHEKLLNTTDETKQQATFLFDQINQWEKDSILKIQQTAQDARLQIQRLADFEKEQTKQKSYQLTKQLEHARKNHEFLENDLYRWIIFLEQLKYDLTILSPSITLQQDQNQALIHKLFISKGDQQSILNEQIFSDSNSIQFDDNHHIAMHCGPDRLPAYIYGAQEYSKGQHQIRLFISKKSCEFVLSFNIMSKLMDISSDSNQIEFLTYGWQTDDCINPSQYRGGNEKNYSDLKGKTKFHIKFFIDCEKHIIRYFNEKTKRMREIMVNVEKCPLPWKLYFYLYDIGDTIRLLSSSQIS